MEIVLYTLIYVAFYKDPQEDLMHVGYQSCRAFFHTCTDNLVNDTLTADLQR